MDKLWYVSIAHVWILETEDRGMFFQPGVPEQEPTNALLWMELPNNLKAYAHLYKIV